MSKPPTQPKPWGVRKPEDWVKQIHALPPHVLKKLDSVVATMIHSSDPRKQGEWKDTKYGPAFVAELDRSYRLAYPVLEDEHKILIIRVGSHPEVMEENLGSKFYPAALPPGSADLYLMPKQDAGICELVLP